MSTNKSAKSSHGSSRAKQPITRSPNYPSINLKEAIGRATDFYQRNGRHGAGFETLASFWGYGAKSSGFRLTLAAIRSFGLVEGVGKGDRLIKLTPLGLDIVTDYPEGSAERAKAIKDAARRPKIHAELWAKYGARLPSDEELRRFLVREREFNDKTVSQFISEYKDTLAFADLSDADRMPPVDGGDFGNELDPVVRKAEDKRAGQRAPWTQEKFPLPPLVQQRRFAMQAGAKEATLPLDTGVVYISWPENISRDEIDDVENWMQLMIRKMKRSTESASPASGGKWVREQEFKDHDKDEKDSDEK
jgi:hypothetical protein